MASIDHLLLRGERVEREVQRVNGRVPHVKGRKAGTLYLTNQRVIFRSKVLFSETVYDVSFRQIADVAAQSNGMTAGHLIIRTTGGDTLRLRVAYNAAAAIAATIRGLQQPAPPASPGGTQDAAPTGW